MFPHAEEVNVEKWLENPVYLLVRFLKLPGDHMTPYTQTCSAGAPRIKAGEEEAEKGEADRVKPRPCDALHEHNLLTR